MTKNTHDFMHFIVYQRNKASTKIITSQIIRAGKVTESDMGTHAKKEINMLQMTEWEANRMVSMIQSSFC